MCYANGALIPEAHFRKREEGGRRKKNQWKPASKKYYHNKAERWDRTRARRYESCHNKSSNWLLIYSAGYKRRCSALNVHRNESFSAKQRMNDVGSNFIDFSFGKIYVTRDEKTFGKSRRYLMSKEFRNYSNASSNYKDISVKSQSSLVLKKVSLIRHFCDTRFAKGNRQNVTHFLISINLEIINW